MVIMASASGNTVPAIARLVQGDKDAIRGVIHWFNEMGLACLDPQWAGGRPRLMGNTGSETPNSVGAVRQARYR
jgi:winged helix-turn helix protein